jgi:RNA 2',3'-cyclic 3'-phosphodiesterase
MRLFIAIQIPQDIRASIGSLLSEFRSIDPQMKWVRAENLHVTLKFLGETDSSKLKAIENSLSTVHFLQPVTLNFSGLGFFPNAKHPSVVWGGVQPSPNLRALAGEIDSQMASLGFPKEHRVFTPHLTLARLGKRALPRKLADEFVHGSSRQFGTFTAREFHLRESKLKSTGAEYTTVHAFSFVGEG